MASVVQTQTLAASDAENLEKKRRASDEEVSHAALSFWIRGILRPGRCLFRFLRMLLSSVCAVAVHMCQRGWGVCLVCSYKCQDPGFPRQTWYIGRLEHPSVSQNRPIDSTTWLEDVTEHQTQDQPRGPFSWD